MDEPGLIRQSYRFALAPTRQQEQRLLTYTGAARFAFNWGLGLVKRRLDQRVAGERVRVPWSYRQLCCEWKHQKDEVAPWRDEVVVGCFQAGFEALGAALTRFSAGKREGRRAGFPRFRAKGRSRESFFFQYPRLVGPRHLRVPKLGCIRTRERTRKLTRLLERDEHARILRATISRKSGDWFASLLVERSPKQRRVRKQNSVVGVDVGLRRLATLSTGDQIPNPRHLRSALRRMRCLQRQLDRQRRAANPLNYRADGAIKRGKREWRSSGRMKRTERRLRGLHSRVANLRRETTHQVTTSLTREFGVIGVESLNVAGMMRDRTLARHIADVGWGLLFSQLSYKTSWAGSTLVVADRFYPSSKSCSACGTAKAKLGRAESTFTCDRCGLVIDRDENAALNLALMALRVTQAEGRNTHLAAAGAERLNARRGQISPVRRNGHSPAKREDLTFRPSRSRKSPAIAGA